MDILRRLKTVYGIAFKAGSVALCVLYVCLYAASANAQYIYENCVTASDFGNATKDKFVIRPLGDICYQRCKSECSKFSVDVGGGDLNADIVENCNMACRSGQRFSSKKRESVVQGSAGSYNWSKDVFTTKAYCALGSGSIDAVGYNEYNTKVRVRPGEKIQVVLANPGGSYDNNAVYLCGASTVVLTPKLESMDPSFWASRKGDWFNPNTAPGQWNARNASYTDTGVDIKDGDYVTITYGGQYVSCTNGRCANPQNSDKRLILKSPQAQMNASAASSGIALPSDELMVLEMNANGGYRNDPQAVAQNNEAVEIIGLHATAWQQGTRFGSGLNFNGKPYVSNGTTNVYAQDTYYTYVGVLSGFSDRYARLAISHPWQSTPYNGLGGYVVTITKKGCYFNNGNRLQYAIGEVDAKSDQRDPVFLPPNSQSWLDLTEDNIVNYEYLNIPQDGLLYLRIKPLHYEADTVGPLCPTSDSSCLESAQMIPQFYTPQNTGGQYYVFVQKSNNGSPIEEVVTKIVRVIRTYILGDGASQEGVAQVIFEKFLADAAFIQAIRALLVFYIAFTGLSFIMGIAPLTQKEAAVRLVKIGIVVSLLSENSWDFFNNSLFKLFTNGALELLVLFTAPADTPPSRLEYLLENPLEAFTVFNEPFSILFGKVTWIKILALMFSGPLGFLFALLVALAGVTYAVCLAKATLLYLVSLIGLSVLLLMAPIFISFILFQYTKQMFDAWLKQLIYFAFQPVVVFTFITVINTLVLIALKVVLGFTACQACWFALSFPGKDTICVIPGYISLFGLHSPDDGINMPLSTVSAVFYFLILVQAMYVFTQFGSKLANLILTSQFVSVDFNKAVSNVIDGGTGIVAMLTGVDSDVQAGARGRSRKIDYALATGSNLYGKLSGGNTRQRREMAGRTNRRGGR